MCVSESVHVSLRMSVCMCVYVSVLGVCECVYVCVSVCVLGGSVCV